tara:strand:+ start:1497 stop:1763 length:267 start_codon:yes stop_codon:yes gene_type:complete
LSGNNHIQQSKEYHLRQGFPISSEEVNDMLDSYLHDLLTILTANHATMNADYKLMLNALADVEGHLDSTKYKKSTKIKDGHTPNWRHI